MATKHPWIEPCVSQRQIAPLLACAARVTPRGAALHGLLQLERETRIPLTQLFTVLADIEHASGREDLGLLAAFEAKVDDADLAHYIARSAATLGDALRELIRYAPLTCDTVLFELHVRDEFAELRLGASAPLVRSIAEYQIISMWRRIVQIAGCAGRFETWFRHAAPRSLGEYRAARPNVRWRFDAPMDALVFEAGVLARPMPGADAGLHAILVEKAEQELERVFALQSLGYRVRSMLREELQAGHVDSEWMAVKLGLSRRTLARHLRQEHTCFKDILNGVRREVSRSLLVRTRISVQEIASSVGYAETSAFVRAFRRWEGMSPMAYRRLGAAEVAEPMVGRGAHWSDAAE